MYFLYFLHDINQINRQVITEAGLDYLPPPETLITRGMMTGPEQRPGLMLADGRCDASDMRYNPQEQTWAKSLNGKFWVGYWNGRRPNEESVRRQTFYNSYDVELGNEEKWKIPIARLIDGSCGLDTALVMDSDGHLRKVPIDRYAAFCRQVEALWQDYMTELSGEGSPALKDDARWQLAVAALGLNYHIGPDEVNQLMLLTQRTMSQTLRAILDIPMLEAVVQSVTRDKKKTAMPTSPAAQGEALAARNDAESGPDIRRD